MNKKVGFEIILKRSEDMTHITMKTIGMITNQN